MIASPTAAGKRPSSSRYVEELHEFFTSHGLPFGSPEDVVGLAERMSARGLFEGEMASMVRSIILREGGNPSLADLLGIVAVAIGGPQMEERAPDFTEPLHKIVKFLTTAFRTRWGAIPAELTHEERAAAATASVLAPVEAARVESNAMAETAPPSADASAYAIHAGRGISAAHAFSAARDISRTHVEAEPGLEPLIHPGAEVLTETMAEVVIQPEPGLEPLVVPVAATRVEASPETIAVTEPEAGLEPLPQPASEIAAQIVADAVIRPEPVVELPIAAPRIPAQAAAATEAGLEPLPHKASEVPVPAAKVRPRLELVKSAEDDDEDRPDLRVPRFLEVAAADHEEFEARPWIRRQAGWVAAACVAAGAIGTGVWAYERVAAQAAWVKEHTHPVTAPPIVSAPPVVSTSPVVKPSPDGAPVEKPKVPAAGLQTARPLHAGGASPHRTYTRVARPGYPSAVPARVFLGQPRQTATPGRSSLVQPAAPVYRVSPPVPFSGTRPAPASTDRPTPPQI
jgi:hypothetical protein